MAALESAHILRETLSENMRYFILPDRHDVRHCTFIHFAGTIWARGTERDDVFRQIAERMPSLERVFFAFETIGDCPAVSFNDLQALFPYLAHIKGTVDRQDPLHHFVLTRTEDEWVFFKVNSLADSKAPGRHKKKPANFSSALSPTFARCLVGLLQDAGKNFLDCGCGSGTALLEACSMELKVTGIDINRRMLELSSKNLHFFSYEAELLEADGRHWCQQHDSVIIDFPYGLRCQRDKDSEEALLKNIFGLVKRAVFITPEDSHHLIESCSYEILQETMIPFGHINRFIYHCRAGRHE